MRLELRARRGFARLVGGGGRGVVLRGGALAVLPGWPASTCSGGQCPETRGLAAADLDRDGRDEVVATTTNTTESGAQVFAFDAAGRNVAGWPRYDARDAGFNGAGNQGYGTRSATRSMGTSSAVG